jgi:BON domain
MRNAAIPFACLAVAGMLASCASARPRAATAAERKLGAQVETVLYDGEMRAREGDLLLVRTAGGAVRITADQPGSADVADGVVEDSIRGQMSLDPMLAGVPIDVDCDDGVVRLAGDVADHDQAARAIRIALETDGVVAVETRMAWIPRRELARLRAEELALRARRDELKKENEEKERAVAAKEKASARE